MPGDTSGTAALHPRHQRRPGGVSGLSRVTAGRLLAVAPSGFGRARNLDRVRHDHRVGDGRDVRVQDVHDSDGNGGADELHHDEHRHARRCDASEGARQHAGRIDHWVGEARGGAPPVRRGDVGADRKGRQRAFAGRTSPKTSTTRPNVASDSDSHSPAPERWWVEMLTASRLNIRLAATAPPTPPASCAGRYAATCRWETPPKIRSARVMTWLKCPPDTGPNARISATSPASVIRAFSRSWSPVSVGESRWAAMPEPMKTVTRPAEPRNSRERLPGQPRYPHGRFTATAFRARDAMSVRAPASASSRSGTSRW
jgi:hypothetical protein